MPVVVASDLKDPLRKRANGFLVIAANGMTKAIFPVLRIYSCTDRAKKWAERSYAETDDSPPQMPDAFISSMNRFCVALFMAR